MPTTGKHFALSHTNLCSVFLTILRITETVTLLSTLEGTITTETNTFIAVTGYSTVTIYTTSWLAPPSTIQYTWTTSFTTTTEQIVAPIDITLTLSTFPVVPPAPTTSPVYTRQIRRPRRLTSAPFLNQTDTASGSGSGSGGVGRSITHNATYAFNSTTIATTTTTNSLNNNIPSSSATNGPKHSGSGSILQSSASAAIWVLTGICAILFISVS